MYVYVYGPYIHIAQVQRKAQFSANVHWKYTQQGSVDSCVGLRFG